MGKKHDGVSWVISSNFIFAMNKAVVDFFGMKFDLVIENMSMVFSTLKKYLKQSVCDRCANMRGSKILSWIWRKQEQTRQEKTFLQQRARITLQISRNIVRTKLFFLYLLIFHPNFELNLEIWIYFSLCFHVKSQFKLNKF